MARTARTVQQMSRAGLAPSYVAVDNTNGETVPNNGTTFIHVKNTGGSPCTVTVGTPGTQDGLAVADLTFSVPATTGDRMAGPFPAGIYTQSDGNIYVDFSTGTSVVAAYINVPS